MIRRAPRTLRERRRRRRAIPLIRPATDLILRLHDGRRLGVAEFGSRSALPVIYLHGFIGSRLEPAAVEIEGTNIISFDRPATGEPICSGCRRCGPGVPTWPRHWSSSAWRIASLSASRPGRPTPGCSRRSGQSRQTGDPGRRHRRARGLGDCRRHRSGSLDDRPPRQPHGPARPPAAQSGADDAPRPPLMAMVMAGERGLGAAGLRHDVLHARLLQSFRAGDRRGMRGRWLMPASWPNLGLLGRRRANGGRVAPRHRRSGGAPGARPLVCRASALRAPRHDPGRAAPLHVLS